MMFEQIRKKNFIFNVQEAASLLDPKLWPLIIDTDDLPKQKKHHILPKKIIPTQAQSLCYLDFSISTTGSLTAVKVCLKKIY